MSQSNQCLGSLLPLAMFVSEGGRILGWVSFCWEKSFGKLKHGFAAGFYFIVVISWNVSHLYGSYQ